MKSLPVASFWWLASIFGVLGLHRFYLRKFGTGLLWFATGGLFAFGAFYDLVTLPMQVRRHNAGLAPPTSPLPGLPA